MPGLSKLIYIFTSSLQHRPLQEQQQAKIRAAIGVLVTLYIFTAYYLEENSSLPLITLYAISFYLLSALILFISTQRSPQTKPLRCIAGFSLDLVTGTVLMIAGGAATAWIYGGFMWVILAYGLRFGKPYMFTAHAIAVVGFSLTLLLNEFWQSHLTMGIGLLVWLIVLPFYVAKLLDIMDQAIQKADIANQAKSRFLANMSHEIRTPLTAIIGYAESALDNDQSMQERVDALSIIKRSGHHLLTIINDILDFSKIEADEMDIENISVNPFQIFSDIEAIAATQAIQKGLSFDVDYQFPLPADITSDPVRLRQIMLNLCCNAIKFTRQGSVKIGVRYLAEENELQCVVTDTGIGIAPDQLQYIFKPFKQADSSTTRHYGGTGLGLSLSKRLTDLLGGKLEVFSQTEKGTTFTLTIPCGEANELVYDFNHIELTPVQEQRNTPTGKLKGSILLAEDNLTNQKLISALLKKMGAEVTTADNGAEALELALQQQYDLIYMDMQMPVMSGLDAVKELRINHYKGHIVALTANATRDDKNMCIDAGCNDYLTKPVNVDLLHQITANYLQNNTDAKPDSDMQPIRSELLHKDSVVNDLLDDFIKELSNMLTHIKMAFVSEDWQDMQATAHDLKGIGGGFGYPLLSELAEKLELELKNKNYKDVRTLLNQIDIMCQRIGFGKSSDSNCA